MLCETARCLGALRARPVVAVERSCRPTPLPTYGLTQPSLLNAPRVLVVMEAVSGQSSSPSSSSPGPRPPGKKKVKKMVDIDGDVTKDLSNGMFQVKLENGVVVIAHLSGKIRQNRVKIVVGDKVTVELSPLDLTRGRITKRLKGISTP